MTHKSQNKDGNYTQVTTLKHINIMEPCKKKKYANNSNVKKKVL